MNIKDLSQENIPEKDIIDLHLRMVKIRLFENHLREALFRNEIKTPCHLYLGEEAIAAGVCVNLTKDVVQVCCLRICRCLEFERVVGICGRECFVFFSNRAGTYSRILLSFNHSGVRKWFCFACLRF